MFSTDYDWLNRLAPDGFPVPASILLSGPGGSGKPLVGLAIAASWLRQGGKVIFVPLQYPDPEYIQHDLKHLYDLELSQYSNSYEFIRFDLSLDPSSSILRRSGQNILDANLVSPGSWDQVILHATSMAGQSGIGTLLFASAINLLLFSGTYGQVMLEYMKNLMKADKSITCLFAVSSNVFKNEVKELEEAADHLLYAEIDKIRGRLQVWVDHLSGAPCSSERTEAPFERPVLKALKERSEELKVVNIPVLKAI